MEQKMKGKTAIVTGGAQGIGKAIARALLSNGARVVIADFDAEAGGETEAEYRALGEILFVRADVSKEEDVKGVVEKAAGTFGGIDILVNNAGIWIEGGKRVTELTLEEWNRVIGVNLTGQFLFAKYAAPHLERSGGVIINIASTRALMSEPGTEAYSASKGGIVALTHALAVDLGPKVRVNCISPGWIEVSGWKKQSEQKTPHHSDADRLQHPAGRVGTPADIASMVVYLSSPDASFITGANFVIDGGMTRKMIYA